jgi:hypothetical protein
MVRCRQQGGLLTFVALQGLFSSIWFMLRQFEITQIALIGLYE